MRVPSAEVTKPASAVGRKVGSLGFSAVLALLARALLLLVLATVLR